MDQSLGDILDHLDALNVSVNTLVFFLGDNGSDAPLGHQHEVACAAPLRGKKGSYYEGGMRVPLIVAWAEADADNPNQKRLTMRAGTIQGQMATVCDLFPTILRVTGIDVPDNHVVDGAPLDTLVTGRPDPKHSQCFLMHYSHAPHRSDYFTCYRQADWKVIYHYYPFSASEDSHYQLYNLAYDPFEQHNLAESNPGQLSRMMQGLITDMERHDALYPVDANDSATRLKPKLPSELEYDSPSCDFSAPCLDSATLAHIYMKRQ